MRVRVGVRAPTGRLHATLDGKKPPPQQEPSRAGIPDASGYCARQQLMRPPPIDRMTRSAGRTNGARWQPRHLVTPLKCWPTSSGNPRMLSKHWRDAAPQTLPPPGTGCQEDIAAMPCWWRQRRLAVSTACMLPEQTLAGRLYATSAHMTRHQRTAQTVVFKPTTPAAHRLATGT